PPTAGPAGAADGPPFFGTEWRLDAVDGAPPGSLPGGDALVTVAFTDGPFGDLEPDAWSLGGYDGCNDFGMGYRLGGDPASPGGAPFRTGRVLSSAMACGDPGAHVSDGVHRGLGAARRVRLADGRLAFMDSLGTDRLAFVPRTVRAVDSAAVVTGRWRLDPAASTVTNGTGGPAGRYTVAFSPDGTYTGEAGCVRFAGEYALRADRLGVTSYQRDDQACPPAGRHWDGPHGLDTGEVEADADRLVVHLRRGGRAEFVRPVP
ncbi:MAG TPA: META domain-containing protein, partial [Rubricoccaceae bacterium]